MSPRDFRPVAFDEPKQRELRPLFTGWFSNALDSFVSFVSALWWVALVLGGLGLLVSNLYAFIVFLISRNSWFSLSALAVVTPVIAFFLWRSSLITRLIIISALAILSLIVFPSLERALV